MAETIIFNLPVPEPYEDPVFDVLWYQSTDGIIWSIDPVDTILVANLPVSPLGQCIWESLLADPLRYHKIKSRTALGVESASAIVLPPQSLITVSQITGISLNNDAIYALGDKVELMLNVDADKVELLGPQISVDIIDTHNNIIASLIADQIGTVYVAEWTIPLGLSQLYNPTNLIETGAPTYFYLRDRWQLNGSSMSFDFKVERILESATEDNSLLQIIIDGVKSATSTICSKAALVFMTQCKPFYCTVTEVKDLYREFLGGIDNFSVARHIYNVSKVVDLHMTPQQINRQESFDLAVRNYTKFQSAIQLLTPMMQNSSETKELDTFKISRSAGDPRMILDHLEAEAKRYALFIWAGGFDTPFLTRRFEKGLWDPSRLVIGRAKLDTSDRFPWVNKTSGNTLMRVDGEDIEVRGERTISLNSNPRFDYSNLIGLENPEGLWLI